MYKININNKVIKNKNQNKQIPTFNYFNANQLVSFIFLHSIINISFPISSQQKKRKNK